MRLYISPKINKNELVLDQKKTAVALIDEMENHFFVKDVVMTTIFIREGESINTVELTTHSDMFDTINAALYEMYREENRKEIIEEVLGKEGYGWRFPMTLLPYMKQLIYQAIEAHDIRAPEDRADHL